MPRPDIEAGIEAVDRTRAGLERAARRIDGFARRVERQLDISGRLRQTGTRIGSAFNRGFSVMLEGARRVGIGLAGVAAAATAIGVAFTRSVFESVRQNDIFQRRTGLSIEATEALGAAIRAVGGDSQDIADFVVDAQERIQDALSDPTGTGARDFINAIGVTPQSLARLETTDERLVAIAQALFRIEDPTVRAAQAQRIFGTVNAETLSVLERLATEGIAPVIREYREAGIVLSDVERQQLRQGQRAWDVLGVRLQGVRNRIVLALMPAFNAIIDWISGPGVRWIEGTFVPWLTTTVPEAVSTASEAISGLRGKLGELSGIEIDPPTLRIRTGDDAPAPEGSEEFLDRVASSWAGLVQAYDWANNSAIGNALKFVTGVFSGGVTGALSDALFGTFDFGEAVNEGDIDRAIGSAADALVGGFTIAKVTSALLRRDVGSAFRFGIIAALSDTLGNATEWLAGEVGLSEDAAGIAGAVAEIVGFAFLGLSTRGGRIVTVVNRIRMGVQDLIVGALTGGRQHSLAGRLGGAVRTALTAALTTAFSASSLNLILSGVRAALGFAGRGLLVGGIVALLFFGLDQALKAAFGKGIADLFEEQQPQETAPDPSLLPPGRIRGAGEPESPRVDTGTGERRDPEPSAPPEGLFPPSERFRRAIQGAGEPSDGAPRYTPTDEEREELADWLAGLGGGRPAITSGRRTGGAQRAAAGLGVSAIRQRIENALLRAEGQFSRDLYGEIRGGGVPSTRRFVGVGGEYAGRGNTQRLTFDLTGLPAVITEQTLETLIDRVINRAQRRGEVWRQ